MVSLWWVIVALLAGIVVGFILAGLCHGASDVESDRERKHLIDEVRHGKGGI